MLNYMPKVISEHESTSTEPLEKQNYSVAEFTKARSSPQNPPGQQPVETKRKKFRQKTLFSHKSVSDTSSFGALARPDSSFGSALRPQLTRAASHTPDCVPFACHIQNRSAVTPSPGYLSSPRTESYAWKDSPSSSSFSDRQFWFQAYQQSSVTSDLLMRLQSGLVCDPYVVSDDGLLYAYVKDSGSMLELPKLVPPEGDIRERLIRDTEAKLRLPDAGMLERKKIAEDIQKSLSEKYWWEDMKKDIQQMVMMSRL